MGLGKALVMTFSRPALTPFALTPGCSSDFSWGVDGCDDIIALPSSESASKSSGGRRSFSISDLRLIQESEDQSFMTQS